MRLWTRLLVTLGLTEPKPPSELDLYRHMDKMNKLIDRLDHKAMATRGRVEHKYWADKTEEAIMAYMEMEWYFHPKNPEGYHFRDSYQRFDT